MAKHSKTAEADVSTEQFVRAYQTFAWVELEDARSGFLSGAVRSKLYRITAELSGQTEAARRDYAQKFEPAFLTSDERRRWRRKSPVASGGCRAEMHAAAEARVGQIVTDNVMTMTADERSQLIFEMDILSGDIQILWWASQKAA